VNLHLKVAYRDYARPAWGGKRTLAASARKHPEMLIGASLTAAAECKKHWEKVM
jgi:hypothetical protein